MSNFKDHFSKQSDFYAKYRPQYPRELYTYLSALTPAHDLAWDCGTGNGQAATGLAEYFRQVIATDPSAQQIAHAQPHERVIYRVEKAEQNAVSSGSVDVLTIANALHWFDFEAFYQEAKRVLKKDGIIAAWAYGPPSVNPEVDALIMHLHDHTLNDYWLAENRLVERQYTTIPFPFDTLDTPSFVCQKQMNLHDLIGYFNTWSAVQRYKDQQQMNPTDQLLREMELVWTDTTAKKTITWHLILKVGKNNTGF